MVYLLIVNIKAILYENNNTRSVNSPLDSGNTVHLRTSINQSRMDYELCSIYLIL